MKSAVSTRAKTTGGASSAARDARFRGVASAAALLTPALLVAVAVFLLIKGWPAIARFGPVSFLSGSRWAPSEGVYQIVQFIFGTVITSLLALLGAVPIGIGVALFSTEIAPARLRRPLVALTEILAMVPSVVYGFWGVFAVVPALRPVLKPLEGLPIIGGQFYGFSVLSASIVLSIMILPIVAAIARDAIAAVPVAQRAGAYALGSTRWEVLSKIVLPAARPGLVVGALLGLGRALGETIAVTMLIGNNVIGVPGSLLAQGATLASVVANEFTEANRPLHLESLFVVSFALLLLSLIVNVSARVWLGRAAKR